MSKKKPLKIFVLLAIFLFLIILLLIFPLVSSISQPTQQYNKLFLSPFYTASLIKNIHYNYSLILSVPDDISIVNNAIITFQLYATSSSQDFYLKVNNQNCNNPSFQATLSGLTFVSFDCSNIIKNEGNYIFDFYSTKDTGSAIGWLDLTYTTNPKGEMKLLGTEYSPNDLATIFVQLKDSQGGAILSGACYLDIYSPATINASHSKLIQDAPMLKIDEENGIYYYDLIAPSTLGVYMLSAKCSYSFAGGWVYTLSGEETSKSNRTTLQGNWAGDSIFLNDFEDWIYTTCGSSGGGTKYCEAYYDFDTKIHWANMTNFTSIELFYMGEASVKALEQFYVWNWTNNSWILLPNTLTFSGMATSVPLGIGEFVSNILPTNTNNIMNNGIIRIKTLTSFGSNYNLFDNWLNIQLRSCDGTIQEIKGSGEMHITNIPQTTANIIQNMSLNVNMSSINTSLIAERIWNYTNRNLTYYEDVTNYTNVASSVWNWAGSVSNSILTSIWGFVNRSLTYYEDTTNYSKVAEYVWIYENRNLTFYEVSNISAGEIWNYMNRTLTLYPDMTNYSQVADYVWNYVDRNLTFEYINNISAGEIWSYYNRSLTENIPLQVWNYPNRNLTQDIPFEIWSYSNRTLTYYTLNLTELIDMINAFEFEEIAIPFPSIAEQNELTSFTLNVRLIIQT